MLRSVAGGVELRVHARPNGKRSEVLGTHGDALRVRLHAPPVEGRANEELLRFIAEFFGLRPTQVGLLRGAGSRRKTLLITGVEEKVLRLRLTAEV